MLLVNKSMTGIQMSDFSQSLSDVTSFPNAVMETLPETVMPNSQIWILGNLLLTSALFQVCMYWYKALSAVLRLSFAKILSLS